MFDVEKELCLCLIERLRKENLGVSEFSERDCDAINSLEIILKAF